VCNAKGKKPKWAVEVKEAGGKLVEAEPANNVPGPKENYGEY
jgi:hypothetical protein